jgi:hypothetical protein
MRNVDRGDDNCEEGDGVEEEGGGERASVFVMLPLLAPDDDSHHES